MPTRPGRWRLESSTWSTGRSSSIVTWSTSAPAWEWRWRLPTATRADALLRNADLAAYNAKEAGRGTFRMFEAGLDARMHERRRLEQDLRRAVACREFEVFYQPQMDARSGQVTGAEALVRWRDPRRGLISPAQFIPSGGGNRTDRQHRRVGAADRLRRGCKLAAAHDDRGQHLTRPVPRRPPGGDGQVRPRRRPGLPPSRLELEITEGVLMVDETRTLATLNELRSCGVRISMDDFGTGYSSLSYLRRFPFDKIKIDQSFVRQLPSDPESVAIVRAILTMGACLGLRYDRRGRGDAPSNWPSPPPRAATRFRDTCSADRSTPRPWPISSPCGGPHDAPVTNRACISSSTAAAARSPARTHLSKAK